eukprot:2535827-Rhodomonas_salina.1
MFSFPPDFQSSDPRLLGYQAETSPDDETDSLESKQDLNNCCCSSKLNQALVVVAGVVSGDKRSDEALDACGLPIGYGPGQYHYQQRRVACKARH